MADRQFIDYYSVLGVDPGCDAKALEAAYHRLAKKFHPDHTAVPDTAKFNDVLEAYRALRYSDRRAEYDELHARHNQGRWSFSSASELWFDENAALNDAEDHAKILMMLYRRRREKPEDAGLIAYFIQEMLNCSHDQFEFHKWYLKEKGWISITEQGTVAITVQGIDHVISMSRSTRSEKLLLGRADSGVK